MRVSDEHQVLFVHIPKNGGSTVDAIFDDEVPDSRRVGKRSRHTVYSGLLKTEPDLADYWAFSFVRNPWARMVSWYVMMAKIWEQHEAGRPYSVNKVANFPHVWEPVRPFVKDFETFVTGAPEAIPRFRRPQRDWLVAKDGREVDFVGRVENFAHDLGVVRERLGLPPAEVTRRNASSHAHYSEYYTDRTRDRVAELFAADIEAWGYTFDRRD